MRDPVGTVTAAQLPRALPDTLAPFTRECDLFFSFQSCGFEHKSLCPWSRADTPDKIQMCFAEFAKVGSHPNKIAGRECYQKTENRAFGVPFKRKHR